LITTTRSLLAKLCQPAKKKSRYLTMSNDYNKHKYPQERCKKLYKFYKDVCAKAEEITGQVLQTNKALSQLSRNELTAYRAELVDAQQKCKLCATSRASFRDRCVPPAMRNKPHEAAISYARALAATVHHRLEDDVAKAFQQLNIQQQAAPLNASHIKSNSKNSNSKAAATDPVTNSNSKAAKSKSTTINTVDQSDIDIDEAYFTNKREIEDVYNQALEDLRSKLNACGYTDVPDHALPVILDLFASLVTCAGIGLHDSTRNLVHMKTVGAVLHTIKPADFNKEVQAHAIYNIVETGKTEAEEYVRALRDPRMCSGFMIRVVCDYDSRKVHPTMSKPQFIRPALDATLGETALELAKGNYARLLTNQQQSKIFKPNIWHIGKGSSFGVTHIWPDNMTVKAFQKQHICRMTHLHCEPKVLEVICTALQAALHPGP
jgi:hypothetical protein